VKETHDSCANIEISYPLSPTEPWPWADILTTNLIGARPAYTNASRTWACTMDSQKQGRAAR
jgi:hypothetical protein